MLYTIYVFFTTLMYGALAGVLGSFYYMHLGLPFAKGGQESASFMGSKIGVGCWVILLILFAIFGREPKPTPHRKR